MNKPKKTVTRNQQEPNQIKQGTVQEELGEDSPLGMCEKKIRSGRRAYYIIGKQLNIIKTKGLFKEKGTVVPKQLEQ